MKKADTWMERLLDWILEVGRFCDGLDFGEPHIRRIAMDILRTYRLSLWANVSSRGKGHTFF
jgi:hypothetical protein